MRYGMLERRSNERFLTDLRGRITNGDDTPPVECTMWDLSATGARLVFSSPTEIPVECELEIPEEGAFAKVRLIWTTGQEYGVIFTD